MGFTRADWSEHYSNGGGFRHLGAEEQALLAEHVPAPEGGRALEACCGSGGLAVFLAELGYRVDAADFAEGALDRARFEYAGAEGVRWLCLDIEHDGLDVLDEDGYDLITMRLAVAFLRDRSRVLHRLAARLREGGALVIITPVVEHTPEERQHIALGEGELDLLGEGFEKVERFEAAGLAVLVLRGPGKPFTAVERGRPGPRAVFGSAAVVTDTNGRVLLGRQIGGMWELPAGGVEAGESAEAAAVRELREEAGLEACEEDAHLLTILHDERKDVVRLSAVVRVTAFTGVLALPEPHRFLRWEFHDLHTLATLGPIFVPSAQALNAVWPGVLPGLAPVRSYQSAADIPPVAGEPDEAVRLRARMAEKVIAGGWAPSARVQAALREVPRHRFTPEVPLETAYHDNLAVVTARDDAGAAVSSVSAAWLQADMLEHLRLEQGMCLLEAGSGGYNAELAAHIIGPHGRVITLDYDPYVVHRTRRLCAEAGSGRVTALLGDGALGAPDHMPAAGFDGIVITHNVWDISPAWCEQLAEDRYLVVPLEIQGYTRAIALRRDGRVLEAGPGDWTYCGFVRDRGTAAHTTPTAALTGGLTIRFEDGAPADTSGLDKALHGPRCEVATGVTVAGGESFETLQLLLATTLEGFCRLAVDRKQDGGLAAVPSGLDAAAAVLSQDTLAYLTYVTVAEGTTAAARRSEFMVHAVGPDREALAEQVSARVRDWDRAVRHTGYPRLTVHPANAPDRDLPAGHVLDKLTSRLVFHWPDLHQQQAGTAADGALASAGEAR
ncbi:methyltransferase, FxLD system [Streptomyces graminilatus]|uniref:methyltransferase, FxLD system n=1 Tax=Streptomyces graminilatus TaxID=1464070 RepID=UPI0006E27890|nr:methyltransferase, FxLD system [Streptomyces graminilatus]